MEVEFELKQAINSILDKYPEIKNKKIHIKYDGNGLVSVEIVKETELSDTSDVQPNPQMLMSDTSALPLPSDTPRVNPDTTNPDTTKQTGGFSNKNIFKSSKYSDTSSVRPEEMSHLSKTSSAVFNARSDKYSDTSVLGQVGGMGLSDTLNSISELKQRKSKGYNSSLDVGIFRKAQAGGSANNNELKKKMMDLGINSSSTSSICE